MQKGQMSFCNIETVMSNEDDQIIIAHYLVLGEDASRVLCPFQEDEDKLERIQWRHTRMIKGWKTTPPRR